MLCIRFRTLLFLMAFNRTAYALAPAPASTPAPAAVVCTHAA